MRQSRIEKEHYISMYSDRNVAFEVQYLLVLYVARRCIDSCRRYALRVSPALNGRSEILHFECSNAIEICDGLMFNFYPGLPHIIVLVYSPLFFYF